MQQTGFIKPVVTLDHYVLGAGKVPLQVIQKDANWVASLPQTEKQATFSFDTCNCTGFGSAHMIEMYMAQAYGIKVRLSPRWIGIIAGTKPPGNDPHTVFEAIRKYGVIPDEMLPLDDSIQSVEDYYSFKGADEAMCRAEAHKWLQTYSFMHEWVFAPDAEHSLDEKINNMKVALKYSPLGIAVYAWQTDENGTYIRLSDDCHWTSQYAYPNLQKIFDSYDPYLKNVNEEITYCKRISITKKDVLGNSSSLVDDIINWFRNLFNNLKKYNYAHQ